jgi:flagellar biosynthesis protein FlhB
MAEESSEEKTEPPSQQHLRKAREEGRVAYSQEVSKVAVFFALGVFLLFQFSYFSQQILLLATAVYSTHGVTAGMGHSRAIGFLFESLSLLAQMGLSLLLVALVVGFAADFLQVGPLLAWKVLRIDFNRCNPMSGFKKIFSQKSLTSLGIIVLKTLLVSAVLFTVISSYIGSLIGLPMGELGAALGASLSVISAIYLWSVLLSCVIGIADYLLKRHEWMKEMFMTKTQVKRENMESFGNPLVKKEMRRLQESDDDMGRMLKNVRRCQVLVTDEEDRVLGLYFNARFRPEPLVAVMAVGATAKTLLSEAAHYNKRVVRDPEFVSTVYGLVGMGSSVPEEHRDAALALINSS